MVGGEEGTNKTQHENIWSSVCGEDDMKLQLGWLLYQMEFGRNFQINRILASKWSELGPISGWSWWQIYSRQYQ